MSHRKWQRVVSELPVEAVLYQAEALLDFLSTFDESKYPLEACEIRDVFSAVASRVRDQLWGITQKTSASVEERRVRRLAELLHVIHSYVRYLQASDPLKVPPAIQRTITSLKRRHFLKDPGQALVLVRPQWKYNLSYTPLTSELSDEVVPADLDPDDELGAQSPAELIEKLWRSYTRGKQSEDDKEKLDAFPRQLAVLSFAGLDSHDTLLFALLCHELSHFIDYSGERPGSPAGEEPVELGALSESGPLVRASFVPIEDLELELGKIGEGSRSEAEKHWYDLLDTIGICRREILADLLATRMLGLGFFIAQAEFLKTIATWPQQKVISSGYPGMAFRLEVILDEVLKERDGFSLRRFLESHCGADDGRFAKEARGLLAYLDEWRERIAVEKRRPSAEAEARESRLIGANKVDNLICRLAAKAVEGALSEIRQLASEVISDSQVPKLTADLFTRITALRCDVPPYLDGDDIEQCCGEIFAAAWGYQLVFGNEREYEKQTARERFDEYEKACRLTLKAIELAVLSPDGTKRRVSESHDERKLSEVRSP